MSLFELKLFPFRNGKEQKIIEEIHLDASLDPFCCDFSRELFVNDSPGWT